MQDKQFQAWQKTRKMGKSKFILFYGLLLWGGLMFLIMTFIMPLIMPLIPFLSYPTLDPSFANILLQLAIYSAGGIAWGWAMWHIGDKKFMRELTKRRQKL